MGWFNEQIVQRKKNDNEAFFESFENIAGAVLGKKISVALNDDKILTQNAIEIILKYYHLKGREVPQSISDMNEQLEFLFRPHGIMRRTANLEKGWYKDAVGAMLATFKSDGSVVALIPTGLTGYSYYDPKIEQFIKIGKKNQDLFNDEVYVFYKPFPLRELSMGDLMKYILGIISPADYIMIAIATLAVTIVGMFSPRITNIVFSEVVGSNDMHMLIAIASFSVCVSIGTFLFNIVRNLVINRVNTKMSLQVQAAAMMRVMSLPASFFKKHSAGDLSSRVYGINDLCDMMVSSVLSTGLTSLFAFIYIGQIVSYAPSLAGPALFFSLLSVGFTLFSSYVRMRVVRKKMNISGQESGMTYSLVSGVQKIKLSGAEKRVFARWGNVYAKFSELAYNPSLFLKISSVLSLAISLVGTLVMYYTAMKSGISVADYYAFNTAYAMVTVATVALSDIALTISNIKPILERIMPILETPPEVSEGKVVIDRLSGSIEMNNVSFRYNDDMPYVLDNLSLKIRTGQYVAICGRTGCGKSTLMRLLLGLETAEKGAIYYDGRDISKIELKSLRRKIGTVMQNGKLFQGDIYSNIVISAPHLTLDDAWKAAEMSGVAEDIRRMPMGMHTLISEGSGGISGGQRQRLMIARAIAPKPKILMFDEATSALDNVTQRIVSESLDSLKCTRIVIAHRLSTIQNCDRIIVLDKGKIVEDGSYEELIAKKGFFAELVERQRLESNQ